MKRKVGIIGAIVALIAGATGIGWLYFRANPGAWDDFLTEMEGESSASAPARPSEPVRARGALAASGNIEADQLTISIETGGRIVEIMAAEGDWVEAGKILLRLDDAAWLLRKEVAQANLDRAMASAEAARAQLELAKAGASPGQLAAADAAIATAQGGVAAAEAAVVQAEINARIAATTAEGESTILLAEAGVARAEGGIEVAQAHLDVAAAERAQLISGARSAEIRMYRALLAQAQSQYLYVADIHEELLENQIGGRMEERARYQADSAAGARDAAQAQLDLVSAGATDDALAAANALIAAAEAEVNIAEAGLSAAEVGLGQARTSALAVQDQVAMADSAVSAAASGLAIARGELAMVEAERDLLAAGARVEEIAFLEAQLAQAEAVVAAAEAELRTVELELSRTVVTAPVAGLIFERLVQPGELASPGAPLFTMADLATVTLTVYISETRLGEVSLGQEVDVSVDAFDERFQGRVSHIAPEAEFTPMTVQTQEERVHLVFAVKITLENSEQKLKPGLPADAVFH